jgi:hypothetical protein
LLAQCQICFLCNSNSNSNSNSINSRLAISISSSSPFNLKHQSGNQGVGSSSLRHPLKCRHKIRPNSRSGEPLTTSPIYLPFTKWLLSYPSKWESLILHRTTLSISSSNIRYLILRDCTRLLRDLSTPTSRSLAHHKMTTTQSSRQAAPFNNSLSRSRDSFRSLMRTSGRMMTMTKRVLPKIVTSLMIILGALPMVPSGTS